jgi:hypothetical protein
MPFGDFFSVTANFEDETAPGDGTGGATDLLGDPWREPKDPRGRKKLKVSNELREKVAVLRAGGMEREEIADAIGCSERTLRTYFLPELNEGKSVKRAAVIEALYAAAVAGSVAAAKAFLALSAKADAIPPAPKPEKLGKKEALLRASQTAHEGSEWGELLH